MHAPDREEEFVSLMKLEQCPLVAREELGVNGRIQAWRLPCFCQGNRLCVGGSPLVYYLNKILSSWLRWNHLEINLGINKIKSILWHYNFAVRGGAHQTIFNGWSVNTVPAERMCRNLITCYKI